MNVPAGKLLGTGLCTQPSSCNSVAATLGTCTVSPFGFDAVLHCPLVEGTFPAVGVLVAAAGSTVTPVWVRSLALLRL